MDDFDPGLVWLRRNGLSREASLRPPLMSLNKTYDDGKTNMHAFVAARGNLKLTCGPEELATKGYLLPEPPVKSRRAKPSNYYCCPPTPSLTNLDEAPKRTAQPSNTKKRSSGKAGTNGSRSTTQAPHDLFPITEVPDQETNPCDATIATQAEIMRQATKEAAAKKQANGTRRVKSEGKIPRVAVPDIEKSKGKRRSVSGPSTKISKEEASRQAAGAKSVGRKKPDFVIGDTSYTLREETEPKTCTSALAAGFLSESLKARNSQEGKPNSIPFSQEPTLRPTILKRPLYTFVPKDAITTPLPASSKEIAQELESNEAGIGWDDTFVDRTAITTPLPESIKEIARGLEETEHGWEDCTGKLLFLVLPNTLRLQFCQIVSYNLYWCAQSNGRPSSYLWLKQMLTSFSLQATTLPPKKDSIPNGSSNNPQAPSLLLSLLPSRLRPLKHHTFTTSTCNNILCISSNISHTGYGTHLRR